MRKLLVIAGIVCVSGVVQADIVSDLQEHWTLDGNANATLDSMFDATFVGDAETYVAGKFGQGIDLERDGVQDYLVVGGNGDEFDNAGGDVTVSLWVTTESIGTRWQAIISNGELGAWRAAIDRDGPGAAYAGGAPDIRGAGDITTAGFHHIVGITEAGVGTRLWVDGVAYVDTTNLPNLTGDDGGDGNLMIGNNPDSTGRGWDGIIDDVAIWSTALTDAEVMSIWNGGDGASIASLVPEPATAVLALFGLAILGLRRRR